MGGSRAQDQVKQTRKENRTTHHFCDFSLENKIMRAMVKFELNITYLKLVTCKIESKNKNLVCNLFVRYSYIVASYIVTSTKNQNGRHEPSSCNKPSSWDKLAEFLKIKV